MYKELTQEEAALLWAQKKRVQATYATNPGAWGDVVPIGSGEGAYWPTIFSKTKESYLFRLAPEPPAKRYRPWKPEEVPVGAQIRAIGLRWRGLILSVCANGEIHCMTGFIPAEHALANHEHSINNGKTWLPCGVEVEP